jgi:hypothetical protein
MPEILSFGHYMLDPDYYNDYLILPYLPVAPSPPVWGYHDLLYLDEMGLLRHRHDLGIQARELIEQYHSGLDTQVQEDLCRRLLHLMSGGKRLFRS